MAGRTPAAAVRAFLEPIRLALACLGPAKISVGRGGQSPKVGEPYQWIINDGAGIEVIREDGVVLTFYAATWWMVIEDERADYGPLRVTTLGYEYSLVAGETTELWALHWHPEGTSWERRPHMHLDAVLSSTAPLTNKSHLPTGRMTFENAIRWVIECGAVPDREDWDARLAVAEAPHILHRSWSGDPSIRSSGS